MPAILNYRCEKSTEILPLEKKMSEEITKMTKIWHNDHESIVTLLFILQRTPLIPALLPGPDVAGISGVLCIILMFIWNIYCLKELNYLWSTVKAGYKNTWYKNISLYKNTDAADQIQVFTQIHLL